MRLTIAPIQSRFSMVGGKLVLAEEPSHLKAKSDNKYFGEEARSNFFKLYQKVRFGVSIPSRAA
jgi:hypothetical protein